jgi:hypothetical protein
MVAHQHMDMLCPTARTLTWRALQCGVPYAQARVRALAAPRALSSLVRTREQACTACAVPFELLEERHLI